MSEEAKKTDIPADGPLECPARKQLAAVFVVLAAVSIALGIKIFTDLFGVENESTDAYSPAILGLLLCVGIGVGLVFAARACRGLRVNADGVAQLEVVEKDKDYTWDKVMALVYCLPRSPDAVEAFWFEVEGQKRCGVPLKCAYQAAKFALARGTTLKIMRYYQITGNDYLEGEAFAAAEKMLRDKLEGKTPQPQAAQPGAATA